MIRGGKNMKTQTDQPQELSRGLKSRHVQLIALGGTIGTGQVDPFGRPGDSLSLHYYGNHVLLVDAGARGNFIGKLELPLLY